MMRCTRTSGAARKRFPTTVRLREKPLAASSFSPARTPLSSCPARISSCALSLNRSPPCPLLAPPGRASCASSANTHVHRCKFTRYTHKKSHMCDRHRWSHLHASASRQACACALLRKTHSTTSDASSALPTFQRVLLLLLLLRRSHLLVDQFFFDFLSRLLLLRFIHLSC